MICIFSSAHPWNDIRIYYKEALSLADKGYKITLIASNDNLNVETIKIPKNIAIVKLNSHGRIFRFSILQFKILIEVIKAKAKIYHFHDPDLLLIGVIMKIMGKKVIYDAHEDVPRDIMMKHWINPSIRKFYSVIFESFENFCARKFDAVITATPFIKERFKKAKCGNVVDINNYPKLEEFTVFENLSKSYHNKDNYVCYFGSIIKERGIKEIIDSLCLSNIKLFLAGVFEPASFKDELMQTPGWSMVEYLGYIGRTDIAKFYSRSICGIVNFYPEDNHINSQPNKLFEYMAAGLPVIASNFPLWKNIVEDNNCGICINPKSCHEIANAVSYLIRNKEAALKMGLNGKNLVKEKYNWEVEEKKLVTIYNKLFN